MKDPDMQHSKTFAWNTVTASVPFVQELMEHSIIYVWHDSTVRVSALGRDTDKIDQIAANHGAVEVQGDKGQWTESWK